MMVDEILGAMRGLKLATVLVAVVGVYGAMWVGKWKLGLRGWRLVAWTGAWGVPVLGLVIWVQG